MIPLSFVIIINGLKDFFEDLKRKQSDNRENKSNLKVVKFNKKDEGFVKTTWDNIKLGQIVKVKKDEYFPCDLILIYSTNKNGVAYVESKNLDGETNLKYKESTKEIFKDFNVEPHENIFNNFSGKIMCDKPNANLYEFHGVLKYNYDKKHSLSIIEENQISVRKGENIIPDEEVEEDFLDSEKMVNLDYNNFMLRGCSLRNTAFIYGIVIYPGHQTKIMLNSLSARSKDSKVTHVMNNQLKVVDLIQFCLSFVLALLCVIYDDPFVKIN